MPFCNLISHSAFPSLKKKDKKKRDRREEREQNELERRWRERQPERGKRWRERVRNTLGWGCHWEEDRSTCALAPPGGQSCGSRSASLGRGGGRSGHWRPGSRPPPLPSFDIYSEPGGPGQTQTLAHPALPLGKAPRFLGLWPTDHPPCPGPGGWAVRMYSIILFWKLNASSFLILYKEETNKVCFCVYCLFIVH